MEQEFQNWLIQRGSNGAAASYPSAIRQISQHYSDQTGNRIDIYAVTGQQQNSEIAHDYSQAGRFSQFGYGQHGRFRNAIARYSEFFVQFQVALGEPAALPRTEDVGEGLRNIEEPSNNFTYE